MFWYFALIFVLGAIIAFIPNIIFGNFNLHSTDDMWRKAKNRACTWMMVFAWVIIAVNLSATVKVAQMIEDEVTELQERVVHLERGMVKDTIETIKNFEELDAADKETNEN